MQRLTMGVDSSTQSTTVEVRTVATGEIVARASAGHPATTPPRSEADPESWWRALCESVRSLGDLRDRVATLSVGGQQHGLVAVDDDGSVIRPAKLWNDTESAPQARELVSRLDAAGWAGACGSVPLASFTISKLAWLVENEPDNARRISRIMLPHDWLTWRMTGEHVTDRGDASGTGWFDPVRNEYRPDLLELVGGGDWEPALPRVLGSSQRAGDLAPGPAAELGLAPGIPVAAGTGDNMAAALGLGLQPGDVAISLGTSGTAFTVSDSPAHDGSGQVAGFADATGRFLPLVCTLNATKVTDAVGRWLGLGHAELADLALTAPTGSNGTVLIPYFDGERTPDLPGAAGALHGLTTSTDRADLARAAHEGVGCGLLNGVDALAALGIDVGGRILLTGGGARSPAYRRVTAELAGRVVTVPDADEVVAAGAALQAAAVLDDIAPLELGRTWGLGTGTRVDPTGDDAGREARAAYDEILSGISALWDGSVDRVATG